MEAMTVFVCIDDNRGMVFNHRPQSRDRVVRADMLREANGKTLLLSQRTAKHFGQEDNIRPVADPLQAAGEGDFCYVSVPPLSPDAHRIRRLILYRWNRIYPADQYLDLNLTADWHLSERTEFSGSSHETITKEIYTPCK